MTRPEPAIMRLALWLNHAYRWLCLSKGAQRLYAASWGGLALLLIQHKSSHFFAFYGILIGISVIGCLAALTELAVRSRSMLIVLQQIDRTIHGVRIVAPGTARDEPNNADR